MTLKTPNKTTPTTSAALRAGLLPKAAPKSAKGSVPTKTNNVPKTRKELLAQKTAEVQKELEAEKAAKKATEDEPELGLIYVGSENESEFLRQTLDFLESLNIKNARTVYYSLPRKAWSIGAAVIASIVLIWATLTLVNAALARLAWESRPSAFERLEGPYNIDSRPLPLLDLSVETGILPATSGGYMLQPAPEVARFIAQVDPSNGPAFDAVSHGTLNVPNLMGACLMSAAGSVGSNCSLQIFAPYAESGIYVSGSDTVTMVAATFASVEDAQAALDQLFTFARIIGVTGNYAIVENRSVDYFYSSSRDNFYFTWTNGTWVYTVNSASINTLDAFMTNFAY